MSTYKHKKQTIWQIYIPLIVTLLLLIVIAILISTPQYSNTQRIWADISFIWISIPSIVIGLLIFILVGALCVLVSRIYYLFNTKIPPFIEKIILIEKDFQKFNYRIIDSVIKVKSMLNTITKRNKSKE